MACCALLAGVAALILALARRVRGRREENTAVAWHLTEKENNDET